MKYESLRGMQMSSAKDSNSKRTEKMLALLLLSAYRVVPVKTGADALSTLRQKKRKVDLVLTHTKLPDMCAFDLVEILDTEFNMAVVMISDEYHEQAILRGLLSGAVFCYEYPLCQTTIDDLWQHAEFKKRRLQEEFKGEMKAALDFFESFSTVASSQNRKRKTNMGLPSSFSWTRDLHCKFLEVVAGLGADVAAPLEVLHCIDVPGLTIESVVEKLQQYRSFLRRQQDLNSNRPPSQKQIQLMRLVGATRPLPYVLPDSLLMRSGLMPLQNAAQIPVEAQAPSASTVAEVPLVIALPALGQAEDETKEDDQVHGRQIFTC